MSPKALKITAFSFLTLVSQLCAQRHGPASTCNQHNECPQYPNPSCTVLVNNETHFDLPRPDLAKETGPGIQRHFAANHSNFPTYTLPLTYLWDSLGIGDLMQKPDPDLSCCDVGLRFTRLLEFPPLATFSWKGPNETITSTANLVLLGTKLTITIKGELRGQANVSAGSTEFWFDKGKEPHLLITNSSNKIMFDADLACLRTSTTSVTVRPTTKPPDVDAGEPQNPVILVHP